jgi:hypothetical protein
VKDLYLTIQVFLFVPMKNKLRSVLVCALMVFTASLFIKAGCSKSSDDVGSEPPPNAEEFITWNINGNKGYLATPADSLYFSTTFGSSVFFGNTAWTAPHSISFYAIVDAAATGNFPIAQMGIYTNDKYYISTSTPSQISISSFGAAGQFVTGTYTGTLKDSTSKSTYSVSGNFKVKRK